MDLQSSVVPFRVVLLVVCLLISLEVTEQQQTLSSQVERAALLALRSSLGLRSRDWPKKADPCTVWNGIACVNGSVSGIDISGFKRTRVGSQNPKFTVDALVNLTKLSSFNASHFLLPGPIPDLFGQSLDLLRVLDLRSCGITNSIPASLGNLTSLTSLNLGDNNITGVIPTSLGQLQQLSVLVLSNNSLTGSIPAALASLKNLTTLDLSMNNLSGPIPAGIGGLATLQYLNLSRNGLSSLITPQLGNLDMLNALDLSFNSFSGSLPANLSSLRNLNTMVLGNNLLGGSLPVNLFSGQNQLQTVALNKNGFNGSVPRAVWFISGLHLLDISGNNFTGTLPDGIVNANASAAVLNMSNNQFFGNVTQILRRFNPVDLSYNYFEGPVSSFSLDNASLVENCLQNVPSQRSLSECTSFYTEKGLVFDNFGQRNSTQPRHSHKRVIILASAIGGVGLALLLTLLVLLLFCVRKRHSTNQKGVGVGPVPPGTSPPPPGVTLNFSTLGDSFTYQQLLQATSNFDDANLIKHGHSGDLYRGSLENGVHVVVKKINLQSTKKESYSLELEFFSKVSYHRLVPLLGHCLENENEKFLVYKYMPNGDLSSSFYKKSGSDDDSLQSLDWITRLKIATGAAEALSYLHHECTPPFVHRDVQASSILLDDKFEVRLGSLSEVTVQEGDTHQRRISRLLRLPQSSEQGTSGSQTATCAYDVYCFGKVLLELVTGKLGMSSASDAQLKEWLERTLPYISTYDKELVTKVLDPSLIIDEDLLEEVWAMAIVARTCLNPKPSRRPLMRYILKALENPLKVVRDDHNNGSARLRTTSSRGSWNAALFGSWRHSSSDVAAVQAGPSARPEGGSGSFKRSGSNSQGSGNSSSRRRQSKEVVPEPLDVERQEQG